MADASENASENELIERWQAQLGHTDWLEWLAEDGIHQALQQWRELEGMDDWLKQMPDRVGALKEVSVEVQRRNADFL